MDPEQCSESEEPDRFLVAHIDFGGSSDTPPFIEIRTAKILDEIKGKKYQDKHCLYLLHRIRGPTFRDPIVFELLERRMLAAVGLLKRELLQERDAIEDIQPSPSEDDSSIQNFPALYMTWIPMIVVPSTPQASLLENQVLPGSYFWYAPNMYRMSFLPRGMCIIINNCDFQDANKRRDGSEHDVRRMEALFRAFLFNCIVHTDKTADEMKKIILEAADSKEHEQAQCLVVILMSHGNQDTILGVDGGTVNLVDDVYSKFNNDECPALQGKPKLFFIQACRGNEDDSGACTTADEAADSMPEPAENPQCAERIATWSDMYIAYAVIPGYSALRNAEIGSWFLSAVYTVFSEHAAIMHLEELMQKVNDEVLQKRSHRGHSQTPSVEKYGWRKPLYFNPRKFFRPS